MSRVFVARRIPEAALEILRRAGAEVTVGETDETEGITRAELAAGVSDCDVLVSLLTEPLDREILSAGKRLRGVAQVAVGYDNIDVAAATELGIPVSNTPGVLTDTSADIAWALILAVARRLTEAHAYVVDGRFKSWIPNLYLGADVGPGGSGRRKVLGVVGYGRIGRAVAKRSIGFEMDVLAYGRRREPIEADELASWADLLELLERSDFVTLHPPLTQETRHLIGEAELRRMKPTAYLINTSRGPVVDEKALVRALREGWIAGAGLDVYEDEPALAPGLAELPNVVLLPHIGSASVETRERMATMAAENAVAHLERRRAPNCIDPGVYDTAEYRRRRAGLG